MVRAEVLQGLREMRFEALLDRHERGGLNQQETAEMPGIGERTFRRWRDRLRDEGAVGLARPAIGKPSSRRAAVEEIQRMLGLIRGTLRRVHGEALSRAIGEAAQLQAGHRGRGRESHRRALLGRAQRRLRDRAGRGGQRLCCRPRRCGLALQIPPLRCDRILCAPRCGCTSIPTVGWRSFTGRIGWPTTIPRERFATTQNWLPEPLRQPA